jgi:serine protease Do
MRTHPHLLLVLALGLTFTLPGHPRPALLASPVARPSDPRQFNIRQTPVVEVVRRVRGAVVNIHSERYRPAPGLGGISGPEEDEADSLEPTASGRVNGMGTGIVIDPRGYIITNHHVIDDVVSLRVTLDGGVTRPARVVARDRQEDLALIKIDPPSPLPVMPLGTARDLMVGETVVAIGNAYGYEHTVSVGIVSALGRDVSLNREVSYRSLIQTDAAINPGNSGGPLVNLYGELVGINVAIRQGAQGIGFAIPADTVVRVAGSLLARYAEHHLAGGTGVSAGLELDDEVRLAPVQGPGRLTRRVTVRQVAPGGAAEESKLRAGDEVVEVSGRPLANSLDLYRELLERPAGDRLSLVVRRGEERRPVTLVLHAARVSGADALWERLGVRLRQASVQLVARSHPELQGGVWVDEVRAASPAHRGALRSGDILVGMNKWGVTSANEVLYVLNHPEGDQPGVIRYWVLRDGQIRKGWVRVEP